MLGQNFTLFFRYDGVLHHSIKKRKYIGGKVKVYENMDSNCFSIPEVKHYCVELGVSDYVQFYFLVLGLDLHNGLRYMSTNGDTHELFKCLDSIDPKIDIYVEHATPVQKQLLVRDVSVVDAANLVGCGVGVEGVGVGVMPRPNLIDCVICVGV